MSSRSHYPPFVRGDIDGFFGLALDNLIQLLLIVNLCQNVLGFNNDLVFGRIMPGAAVSLLVGNLFYAWQAHRLARKTGRSDVCALPYGINTVTIFAHVFFVLMPAKIIATTAGFAQDEANHIAWQAGLVATLVGGLIEFAGSFVAGTLRKYTPRAALLSTLAAIALGFIALGFLFRTFAHPLVGLTTLGVVLLVYFGRVRFKGGIPGGLVAVLLGMLLAWSTGLATSLNPGKSLDLTPRFYPPIPVLGELWAGLTGPHLVAYLSVIVPMGIFNLIGSLQNIESAEAAGDSYPTAPSLAVNGLGSIAAACFGSVFPTTIYIGHPGWKALGARAGYSTLNGLFCTVIALFGWVAPIAFLVPIDAGMAIVLWIGVVITAQAFTATPREHAPAVAVGLLPGVGAWGVLMLQTAFLVGGVKTPPDGLPALVFLFERADLWVVGALSLEKGFIFTGMILAAATVELIERRFERAALWCLVGSVLSLSGLMHAYGWNPATPNTTSVVLFPPLTTPTPGHMQGDAVFLWGASPLSFALAYTIMAGVFVLARYITVPNTENLPEKGLVGTRSAESVVETAANDGSKMSQSGESHIRRPPNTPII